MVKKKAAQDAIVREVEREIASHLRECTVPSKLLSHYKSGVVAAKSISSYRYDPFFALGSGSVYKVRFHDGARCILEFWGNTDGCGIEVQWEKR